MNDISYQNIIEQAWNDRSLLKKEDYQQIIRKVIDLLDKGTLRVAHPLTPSQREGEHKVLPLGFRGTDWQVNAWLKKTILLYFIIQKTKIIKTGDIEFYDKIPLKKNFARLSIRVVPPAVVRYGSYVAKGVILMPCFVNIGAYIDEGTMIDTWATVGSCAQIGKNVHISGGVGIGGVLEPIQDSPVIIEDNCFIGSRSIIVEGVRIEKEAVIGANVVLTRTMKIIDVTQKKPVEYRGIVPERSIVIQGSYTKKFPAGEFQAPCALIIGKRKATTDTKTSLNEALRQISRW